MPLDCLCRDSRMHPRAPTEPGHSAKSNRRCPAWDDQRLPSRTQPKHKENLSCQAHITPLDDVSFRCLPEAVAHGICAFRALSQEAPSAPLIVDRCNRIAREDDVDDAISANRATD